MFRSRFSTLAITPEYAETASATSVVLEAEADLHADLEVLDLAILDLAANAQDLEPVTVTQGLAGALDAVEDGLVDALRGGADDLGDAIGAVAHAATLVPSWEARFAAYSESMARESHDDSAVRITTAAASPHADILARQKRYLYSMSLRTICFIGAVIVGSGVFMYVLIAGAVFLPYVAVVMANAAAPRAQALALRDSAYTPHELH